MNFFAFQAVSNKIYQRGQGHMKFGVSLAQ